VFRNQTLIAEGRSVVACISRDGRIKRLPDALLSDLGAPVD
jgi:hypothetical protein